MDIDVNDCRFGFIGAGKIAFSIAKGLIEYGNVPSHHIHVSAPTNNNLPSFAEIGCHTTNVNGDLFGESKSKWGIIFICVKPYVIHKHIKEKKLIFNKSPQLLEENFEKILFISVVAGITIVKVKQCLITYLGNRDDIKFARLMPNTACSIGNGVCGVSPEVSDPEIEHLLITVLKPLGYVEIVPESQLNIICGLCGSGIAFGYNVIQSMADGAVKMGLPRNSATKFAAHTLMSAAKMILETKRHPIELRDDVTSPGGTTIYGLHAYEKAAVSSGMIDTVEAAIKRANELSN